MKRNNTARFIPLIVALGVTVGILIGSFYANHFSGNRLSIINNSNNKIGDLLHIIEDQYVDTVNINTIIDKSLNSILTELDPHSTYTPAKDVAAATQELKGHFSGIGIQFILYQDTVRVVKVIPGGPSEGVGLQAGDKILRVDGKRFVGKDLNTDTVQSMLKGPDESVVKLDIRRGKETENYTIIRGSVPIKSIDAVYMIDEQTGYIRINTFAENTYAELLAALAKLNHAGFKNLVIDLQNNTGGYLHTAVQIANEFLPKNQLIVYMQGRRFPRDEYRSDGRGSYQHIPLVILINELSASSSEIFSGAIQDNDRGMIIGRRSFGKGVVQEPIEFSDGSMLRLTVARYYTPSGRCVQKEYTHGDEASYEMDLVNRFNNGESFYRDSIKTRGQKYKTRIGRAVYGGGGIIPDYFVPVDTLNYTSYFQEAASRALFYEYAYVYTDKLRTKLQALATPKAVIKYLTEQQLPYKFADFAATKGLARRNLMIRKSYQLIESHIIQYILNALYDTEVATAYANQHSNVLIKALQIISRKETFPALKPYADAVEK